MFFSSKVLFLCYVFCQPCSIYVIPILLSSLFSSSESSTPSSSLAFRAKFSRVAIFLIALIENISSFEIHRLTGQEHDTGGFINN